MNRPKTFHRGGVHPHDSKELTRGKKIETLPMPEKLIVPLQQAIGKPAKPVVKVGDKVKVGSVLAEADGFVSAPVHSPASGTITEQTTITLPSGMKSDAFVIKTDNPGSTSELDVFNKVNDDWQKLDVKEIFSRIQAAGVVGMGGATFPAHVKDSLKPGQVAEFLIINGAECEPFLTSDHSLMLEKSKEIIQGVGILCRLLEGEKAIVAIENNKKDAQIKMQEAVDTFGLPITIQPMVVKYPQGDEKNLINAITGREVPSGGLPIDVGCVVANIGTCYAVFEAVVHKKPLISRVVTFTGDAVKDPKNLLCPIGATVQSLADYSGGFVKPPRKMISGGPMMGFTFPGMQTPVTKGTSGITCLSTVSSPASEEVCISCGRCTDSCPMGLVPTRLYKLIRSGKVPQAIEEHLMDCRECGCCAFTCPAHIPLVQGFRLGKKIFRSSK